MRVITKGGFRQFDCCGNEWKIPLTHWTSAAYSPECPVCGKGVRGMVVGVIVGMSPGEAEMSTLLGRVTSRLDFVNILATGVGVGDVQQWALTVGAPFREVTFDMVSNPASWGVAVDNVIGESDSVLYVGDPELGVQVGISAAVRGVPVRSIGLSGETHAAGREMAMA